MQPSELTQIGGEQSAWKASHLDAGVCLTYDDWFVDEWFFARELFKSYGVRVTFFVAKMDVLTDDQFHKLLLLQQDGHEIGCHTINHCKLPAYLLRNSVDRYLKEEVDEGLAILRSKGLRVDSFAYPYHEVVDVMDGPLLSRFSTLRYRRDGPLLQERVYRLGSARVVNVMGSLDITGNEIDWDHTTALLDVLERERSYGVFCGHNIGKTGPKGTHFCSLADLEQFLNHALERRLGFATVRELAYGQVAR